MKVIGLTGGIGTGKSTVARVLAELGAAVIDADKVGHEAFQLGSPVREKVVSAFGGQIMTAEGQIDRDKLAQLVFASPDARAELNRIMHPAIYEMVKTRLDSFRKNGARVAVIEAPLLVEAGWTSFVDEVWVTVASEVTVLKRLKQRTGMSETESLVRIASQLSSEERVKHASVIINTDCTLDEVRARVKAIWQRLGAEAPPP
ncbi:MAG: dephospho-CoA kinase [Dehalococcoidales bacterium]|nr:dephospho-CoA kinase [Dehalococcoidales bacterium]